MKVPHADTVHSLWATVNHRLASISIALSVKHWLTLISFEQLLHQDTDSPTDAARNKKTSFLFEWDDGKDKSL
jgi:hypothetical protein